MCKCFIKALTSVDLSCSCAYDKQINWVRRSLSADCDACPISCVNPIRMENNLGTSAPAQLLLKAFTRQIDLRLPTKATKRSTKRSIKKNTTRGQTNISSLTFERFKYFHSIF